MTLREFIKKRYLLQLVSERKGRPVFSYSMSIWLTALVGLLSAVMLVLLVIVVMTRSPLRQYLPGYLDVSKRGVVEASAMRIDSLEHENRLRRAYLDNVLAILNDQVRVDTLQRYDSVAVHLGDSLRVADDSLRVASEREAAFVDRYAARERFGLNALVNVEARGSVAGPSFLSPVRGTAQPAVDGAPLRIDLDGERPVIAPQEGWVVMVEQQAGQGWTVVLQMPGDWMVTFTRLTLPMVSEGEACPMGRAIGHAGAQADASQRWIGVRLWQHGREVDVREAFGY